MSDSTFFEPHLDILPEEQRICWSLLNGVSEEGFVLYGGTALALRLGHRQSVDFDFFSHLPLNRGRLLARFPFLLESEDLQNDSNAWTVRFCPKGGRRDVKLSFFGTIDFGRVGRPDLSTGPSNILVASLDDIMATKLKVLFDRVSAKDYVDIATMIEKGVSLTKGLASARALFGKRFSPQLALDTLIWFEGMSTEQLPQAKRRTLLEKVRAVVSSAEVSGTGATTLTAPYLVDNAHFEKLMSYPEKS